MKLTSTRQANPEGRMPLMGHIRELRNRLIKAILGLLACTIVGWIFFDPVWEFLKEPYCALPQSRVINNECTLVVSGIFSSFFLQLKIAFIIGLVLSAPIWLYQLWAFVAPGLYHRERRWTYLFLGASIPLFFVGVALAYVTVDKGLSLFLSFVADDVSTLITVDNYLGYVLAMLLVFGLTFELPLFVVILNLAGVLTFERIQKSQRMIVFGVFVFAAVATPSGDPFTMMALALPTLLLFELATVLAFFNDRRKARRPDPYAGLSDDEAAPLDLDDTDDEIDTEVDAGLDRERGERP
jgi:sec-independent protein translocase protein TatC